VQLGGEPANAIADGCAVDSIANAYVQNAKRVGLGVNAIDNLLETRPAVGTKSRFALKYSAYPTLSPTPKLVPLETAWVLPFIAPVTTPTALPSGTFFGAQPLP